MTRVIVTGGAGFIGSHLVDKLVESGYEVTVLDNLSEQVHEERPDYLNSDAKYVWGNVQEEKKVAPLLREADVLSHHAGAVGVGQSMYDVKRYVDENSLGTATLLDIIINQDIALEKMVIASSMTLYGEGAYHCSKCQTVRYPSVRADAQMDHEDWKHYCAECGESLEPCPTPEDSPTTTKNVYAITKKNQEELALAIGRAYDIPTVALRYFNVYGSRQSLDNPYTGVCAIFSSRIKNNNPPLAFEDGKQSRDFIHVTDVARANIAAIESSVTGETINIGSGVATEIRKIASSLIELYDMEHELEPKITGEYRSGDVRHCYADTAKAQQLLDFEPEVEFQDGMAELVRWATDRDATDRFEQARQELKNKGLTE